MRDKRCPARRSTTNSAVNASTAGRKHQQQQQQQQKQSQPRRRLAVARRQASSSSSSSPPAAAPPPAKATSPPGEDGNRNNSSSSSESSDEESDTDSDSSNSNSSSRSSDEASSSSSLSTSTSNGRIIKSSKNKEGDAMQTKLDWKLVSLYTLLVLQILVVMLYVASMPHVSELNNNSASAALRDTVSFVESEVPQLALHANRNTSTAALSRTDKQSLRIVGAETTLRETKTFRLFQAYNQTLCWRSGVDERRMRRDLVDSGYSVLDRCACLAGWHGSDCGQPEVVWRAIMASKQNVQLSRRKLARRLVHTFYVHDYNTAIVEVIVEELYPVVDLFVICDFSQAEDNFRHKLAKGFLGKQQDKILYLNVASKSKKPARVVSKYVWERVKKVVRNLRDDDIYVTTDAEQILNGRALMFLKTYDGWPQPIGFRLRWSVFGFFWQHPSRTKISLGASSLALVRDSYPLELNEGIEVSAEQQPRRDSLGLVIGDLNHYGGWFCQFCQGPANIITALREKNRTRELVIERSVDVPFVEDLIGSGTWFDEKTSLLRAYRSRDAYYAPETVLNNTWKYDWLVENFYAKLDYY